MNAREIESYGERLHEDKDGLEERRLRDRLSKVEDRLDNRDDESDRNVSEDAVQDRAEAQQRQLYGGFNFGAAFFGWLVATSVGVLLTSLLAALGGAVALTAVNNPAELTQNADTVGISSALALLVVFAVAYYAGGYVAGRMSRFDGGRQGLGTWLMGIAAAIILGAAGAALGSNFNLLQSVNLPSLPVSGESFTGAGLATLLGILIVSSIAAISGGKTGERYHHKVDAAGYLDEQAAHHGISSQRLAHHH